MKPSSILQRRTVDVAVKVVSGLAALVGCFMLCWILLVILQRGAEALNWDFFTQLPQPPGVKGGGVANALVGSLVITMLATVIGVPLGFLGGVFLAEYGQGTWLAAVIRFCANLLVGVPSIIIGVFVFALMVQPMHSFSGYAGAVSLAIIMFPIVVRATEDMLNLVPNSLREAALALGAPRWRVTFGVTFRAAKVGILTGALLAVARVSGETAPLLFTCLNSPYWLKLNSPADFNRSFSAPTANLTVTIFNQAMSPYADWQRSAWAASLVITMAVLLLTITSRFILRTRN